MPDPFKETIAFSGFFGWTETSSELSITFKILPIMKKKKENKWQAFQAAKVNMSDAAPLSETCDDLCGLFGLQKL